VRSVKEESQGRKVGRSKVEGRRSKVEGRRSKVGRLVKRNAEVGRVKGFASRDWWGSRKRLCFTRLVGDGGWTARDWKDARGWRFWGEICFGVGGGFPAEILTNFATGGKASRGSVVNHWRADEDVGVPGGDVRGIGWF
jgi:hypothetical protein